LVVVSTSKEPSAAPLGHAELKAKAVERQVRTDAAELPFRVDRAELRSRRREEK
jgi:hypothetical protein